MVAAFHGGDRERNVPTGFDGALCFRERFLRVEVGGIDADHLLDEHVPAAFDHPVPTIGCRRVEVEDEGWIHLPATPLQSSGSTVTNRLPSLSWTLGLKRSPTCSAEMGATGGSGCGCGVSTTCVQPPRTRTSKSAKPRFPMSASLRKVAQPTHSRRDRRSGGFYSHFCAHSSVWAKLKLAVAGGGGGRHLFQTPFGDSVFDAVGQLRARPGAGRIAAGLPDLGEVGAAL